MRHGISYIHAQPGLEYLPADYRCEGYPVRCDPDMGMVAIAAPLPVKNILVGHFWFKLPYDEQHAVLLHEAAHLRLNHFLKRLPWVPLFWTEAAARFAQRQELEADAYVIERGYGEALLRFLARFPDASTEFHPDVELRRQFILSRITRSPHAQAA